MKIIYTHTDEAPALATQLAAADRRAFAAPAGVEVEPRDISLAGRILAQFPDRLATSSGAGRAGRARRAGQDARGEHHQAAEHQRLGAAAQGAIEELQAQGFADPRLPGEPVDRRGARRPRALRRGQGHGGQPGAARGQLRPPRARVGQGVTPRPTRTRWASGRRTRARTWRRWATATSARPSSRSRSRAEDDVRIEHVAARRHGDGAQGVDAAAGRRGHRRRGHAPRGARGVPRRAGGRRARAGRPVLAST